VLASGNQLIAGRMASFAGGRLPSLEQLCVRWLQRNVTLLDDLATVPLPLAQQMLLSASADDLRRIEVASGGAHRVPTAARWRRLCARRHPRAFAAMSRTRGSPVTGTSPEQQQQQHPQQRDWRALYERAELDAERRRTTAQEAMRNAYARTEASAATRRSKVLHTLPRTTRLALRRRAAGTRGSGGSDRSGGGSAPVTGGSTKKHSLLKLCRKQAASNKRRRV
jgi:RNA polymerase II transcription factor SIII (Elongin) subunit A